MKTFQSFRVSIDGERLRVARFLGPRGILYIAKFGEFVFSIIVCDGNWTSYGGPEKDSDKLKSAIVEWNAIAHDSIAKLDSAREDLQP